MLWQTVPAANSLPHMIGTNLDNVGASVMRFRLSFQFVLEGASNISKAWSESTSTGPLASERTYAKLPGGLQTQRPNKQCQMAPRRALTYCVALRGLHVERTSAPHRPIHMPDECVHRFQKPPLHA